MKTFTAPAAQPASSWVGWLDEDDAGGRGIQVGDGRGLGGFGIHTVDGSVWGGMVPSWVPLGREVPIVE
ncbi:hypothetical protein [Corynebacterium confusum]|uniref:hypothetical protein n=1 Tax=Corynebacterium confusum TaxID=71254 RepID=UPI0025B344AA|nr:hypothetical protein [Corynebacterium confusum]WJY90731.1 hypothetical protein CCONF_11205 [Corynebacterium confusum]